MVLPVVYHYLGPYTSTPDGDVWPSEGVVAATDLSRRTDRSVGLFSSLTKLDPDYALVGVDALSNRFERPIATRELWKHFTGRSAAGDSLAAVLENDLLSGPAPVVPDRQRVVHIRHGPFHLRSWKLDVERDQSRSGYITLLETQVARNFQELRDADGEELAWQYLDYSLEKYLRLPTFADRVAAWKEGRGHRFVPPEERDVRKSPIEHTTTVTEDFDGADKAGVGYDQTWTEMEAAVWNNTGNAAELQAAPTTHTANRLARCDTVVSTDDHEASATISQSFAVGNQGGVAVRCNTSTGGSADYYCAFFDNSGNLQCWKVISGGFTILGKVAHTYSSGDTIKLQADGSNVYVYANDALKIQASDPDIGGNVRGGIYGYFVGGVKPRVDDWSLADITPAAANTINLLGSVTSTAAGTTGNQDTTGAKLIVARVSDWSAGGTPTFSDNQGNSYTTITQSSGSARCRLLHCLSPSTSSTHTFSVSSLANTYPAWTVAWFDGVAAFDTSTGASASSASSVSCGSLTPSGTDETLLVAAACQYADGDMQLDNAYAFAGSNGYGGGSYMGGALTYKIVDDTTALNPKFLHSTGSNFSQIAAIHAEFYVDGGVTAAPSAVSAVGATVSPTTVLGSIANTPLAASTTVAVVDASVVLGPVALTPISAGAQCSTTNSDATLGSVTVAAIPADSVAAAPDPLTVLGPVQVSGAAASAIVTVALPVVVASGGQTQFCLHAFAALPAGFCIVDASAAGLTAFAALPAGFEAIDSTPGGFATADASPAGFTSFHGGC